MFIVLALASGLAWWIEVNETQTLNKLSIFSLLICFFKTIGLTNACEKLIMRMRAQAFENVLRQPVFWFDLKSSSPGNLVTKLARDAPLVKSVSILSQLQWLIHGWGQ